MDTQATIHKIYAEVGSRSSQDFGIKVGSDLFSSLASAGKIKKVKFDIMGTKLFECELPAYDGIYAVSLDWEMDPNEFKLGSTT